MGSSSFVGVLERGWIDGPLWTILPQLRMSRPETSVAGSPAMTVRDVAAYLNVDEKTVYRLASRGGLPGFKVAGTWRFKRNDIDVWIDEQKERQAKAKARPRL